MKKFTVFALALFAVVSFAWAEYKPTGNTPLITDATKTTVSAVYAVESNPKAVLNFRVSSKFNAVGVVEVQGSSSTEAEVLAGTAKWTVLHSTSSLRDPFMVLTPPAFVRVRLVHSAGEVDVLMRPAMTTVRKVK